MPEQPAEKSRPHVVITASPQQRAARAAGIDYAELEITSNFSFLRGGSHPEELAATAAESGCRWFALTDLHTLAGIVRAHMAAKEAGVSFIVGCRVVAGREKVQRHKGAKAPWEADARIAHPIPCEGTLTHAPAPLSASMPQGLRAFPLELLVYPASRAAYGRMCRLLTTGKRRAPKGHCTLSLDDLLQAGAEPGLLAILIPPEPALADEAFFAAARRLRDVFNDDRLSLAARCLYDGQDDTRLAQLADMARRLGLPLVATNDVHYHVAQRRPLQDILTCIRLGCTVKEAGFALFAHAERHLKGPAEMARLFALYPEAIARTAAIARRASTFSLDDLKYEYPHEICPPGKTLMEHLRQRTWEGARERYGGTSAPRKRLDKAHRHTGTPAPGPADARSPQSMACKGTLSHAPAPLRASGPSGLSTFENDGIPSDVHARLEHELALIEELHYAAYFLTVDDIVRFARSRGILCQGRGAAANSAVCYCLGITAVDPARIDLLVERFISRERNEPPDIDIDFEHERREEVIQYIYHKYGRDRAALVAEVISYRRRSAIRDVGKALGLSLDAVDRLARSGDWWDHDIIAEERLAELGFDPHDVTLRRAIKLAAELRGFPRHLSQHVGGFVISRGPLCEIVPIENAAMEDRTVIEWDKDDIDDMGMLKIDCLGLGMLTCIRKAINWVNVIRGNEVMKAAGKVEMTDTQGTHSVRVDGTQAEGSLTERIHGTPGIKGVEGLRTRQVAPLIPSIPQSLNPCPLQFHTIPPEDPAVYDMLCRADSVGVFQVESRAQMTMLPRLKPRHYYDLVIEVAIVRPGPIQGGMVHPYLRRRNGQEDITYPNEQIRKILSRTLGIPLFQEQAMRLVMVAAGFTAGEADQLRRAMAAWKRKGHIMERFARKIVTGMVANGYTQAYALKVVEQIRGFSEYGFPESHAASFALLVYVSAWLKCHHPAAFAAALINSQPMGFYQPAQIIRDAREHGVEVRPVDVHFSTWDCTLEVEEKVPLRHQGTNALKQGNVTNTPAPSGLPCLGALVPSSPALRLGMRLVTRMRQTEALAIATAVEQRRDAGLGLFTSIEGLWRASGVRVAAMKSLAQADAFHSMGIDRQRALWQVLKLRDDELPLLDGQTEALRHKGTKASEEAGVRTEHPFAGDGAWPHATAPLSAVVPQCLDALPPIPLSTQVVHDYAALGLSLKAHPMAFARRRLDSIRITPAGELADEKRWPHGKRAAVAGLVLVRQRPATASGILFITLEDETGVANLIVRPALYEKYRRALRHSVALVAWGTVERQGQVVHLLVRRAADLADLRQSPRPDAPRLAPASRDFH